jgi:phosphoribosyl 1,2-cyclic phosphate phosphodiesterase
VSGVIRAPRLEWLFLMQITFLGTSAANAYPEAFCNCENCQRARLLGGKSLRKRSAALINDDLLIDLGPDIMAASQMHNIPLTNVCYCLQTHPHADHLDLSHLLSRSPGYGVVGAPRLHFYASAGTLEHIYQTFRKKLADYNLGDPQAEDELNLKIHQVDTFKPFRFGVYQVIPLPANHALDSGALLYAITSHEKSILYATDTAPFLEATWQAFQQFKLQFDLVVLDHTYGPDETGGDHLSAHQVSQHAERLRAGGFLKGSGRLFATHIAHQGNPVHPLLVEFAARHGYDVAYDGLSIKVGQNAKK